MRGRLDGSERQLGRTGFTLIEVLVVILIIMIVSVLGFSAWRSSFGAASIKGAQLLQASLAGARDEASRTGRPAGIRLLPDPNLITIGPNGRVDPMKILAYDRIIPIGVPPSYSEGSIAIYSDDNGGSNNYSAAIRTVNGFPGRPCLVLESAPVGANGAPNPPTSWFWNLRVGEKIQFGGAGNWYTIVGPVVQANSEQYVNNGPPGTALPKLFGPVPCEYLLLVNGRDDNKNGWIDEGFDGVDNNGDGIIDN